MDHQLYGLIIEIHKKLDALLEINGLTYNRETLEIEELPEEPNKKEKMRE